MIFFKALKYKILDIALGILFEHLGYNFLTSNRIPLHKLKTGQFVRRISYKDTIYYNCTVDDIHKDTIDDGWFLYILFEDTTLENQEVKEDGYMGFWIEHFEQDLIEIYN